MHPSIFKLGVFLEDFGRFQKNIHVVENIPMITFLGISTVGMTGSLVGRTLCVQWENGRTSLQRGVLRSVAGGFQKCQFVRGATWLSPLFVPLLYRNGPAQYSMI